MSRSACAWCTWAKIKDGICVGNVEKKNNRHKDRRLLNKSNQDNKKKNQDNQGVVSSQLSVVSFASPGKGYQLRLKINN